MPMVWDESSMQDIWIPDPQTEKTPPKTEPEILVPQIPQIADVTATITPPADTTPGLATKMPLTTSPLSPTVMPTGNDKQTLSLMATISPDTTSMLQTNATIKTANEANLATYGSQIPTELKDIYDQYGYDSTEFKTAMADFQVRQSNVYQQQVKDTFNQIQKISDKQAVDYLTGALEQAQRTGDYTNFNAAIKNFGEGQVFRVAEIAPYKIPGGYDLKRAIVGGVAASELFGAGFSQSDIDKALVPPKSVIDFTKPVTDSKISSDFLAAASKSKITPSASSIFTGSGATPSTFELEKPTAVKTLKRPEYDEFKTQYASDKGLTQQGFWQDYNYKDASGKTVNKFKVDNDAAMAYIDKYGKGAYFSTIAKSLPDVVGAPAVSTVLKGREPSWIEMGVSAGNIVLVGLGTTAVQEIKNYLKPSWETSNVAIGKGLGEIAAPSDFMGTTVSPAAKLTAQDVRNIGTYSRYTVVPREEALIDAISGKPLFGEQVAGSYYTGSFTKPVYDITFKPPSVIEASPQFEFKPIEGLGGKVKGADIAPGQLGKGELFGAEQPITTPKTGGYSGGGGTGTVRMPSGGGGGTLTVTSTLTDKEIAKLFGTGGTVTEAATAPVIYNVLPTPVMPKISPFFIPFITPVTPTVMPTIKPVVEPETLPKTYPTIEPVNPVIYPAPAPIVQPKIEPIYPIIPVSPPIIKPPLTPITPPEPIVEPVTPIKPTVTPPVPTIITPVKPKEIIIPDVVVPKPTPIHPIPEIKPIINPPPPAIKPSIVEPVPPIIKPPPSTITPIVPWFPKPGSSGGDSAARGGHGIAGRKSYKKLYQKIPKTVVYIPNPLKTSPLKTSLSGALNTATEQSISSIATERTLAGQRQVFTVAPAARLKAGATEANIPSKTYRGRQIVNRGLTL